MSKKYLALLRGINVGGNNIIKMADLKICFEEMGFSKVKTYIQSGNVIFSSDLSKEKISHIVSKQLEKDFNYSSTVVIISDSKLKSIVSESPNEFGKQSDKYKYDVIFLQQPITAKEAIKHIKTRDGVDSVKLGDGVLYYSRLTAKLSKSYLSKITQTSIYKQVTIRNWNTTTKLMKEIQQ